jgi:hypothetical protein
MSGLLTPPTAKKNRIKGKSIDLKILKQIENLYFFCNFGE